MTTPQERATDAELAQLRADKAALVDTLHAAASSIRIDRGVLIGCACAKDEKGEPILDDIDPLSKPFLDDYDAVLARIDATLANHGDPK